MQKGDLVNYVGDPFAGPSVGGIVVDVKTASKTKRLGYDHTPEERCEVFWASHLITSWVTAKRLERIG